MRQFVFGLLVVLLLWWGCSRGSGTPAQGASDPGTRPPAGAASHEPVGLRNILTATDRSDPASTAAPAPTNGGPTGSALAARPTPVHDAAVPVDVDGLLERVAQRTPEAISDAWRALAASNLGEGRARVVSALAPTADDFGAMLAALGSDNGFLHSGEGRAAANKVLDSALRMPDADAVLAVSRLLGLCVRGRLEKTDLEVRAFVDEAYRQHVVRVDRWLCDPGNVARARSYTVVKGDSLAAIAGRFRREGIMVEDGTLAVLNRIHNPNSLQVGQKLKVPIDPIVGVVEKRSYSMAVYVGEYLMRLYWVGHGENDKTPVTEFTVGEKQPKPEWTAPNGERYPYGHPKNILGEYFIKFRHDRYTGFGAHGTPMPETIGTMSSMGCIRMVAPDIAELFRLLPRGAKVQVRASESIR